MTKEKILKLTANHTYDEVMADEVYQAAKGFVSEGKKLLQAVEEQM